MKKKYWVIKNEMYSAYDTHIISNIIYGTWLECARECVKNTQIKGDYRSLEELKLNHYESGFVTFNFL